MIKRIKESIGLKTFLSMMSLLVICCIIIYGLVLCFLPKNFQNELESQFTSDFQKLVGTLEQNGIEENTQQVADFSIKNNASVLITDANELEIFSINTAAAEGASSSDKSLSTIAKFDYNGQSYAINATASFIAVTQSYDVLLKLLPFIAVVIILIAIMGAYICSHSFSKPLVEICDVAKRMTNLDMTWKCNTSRSDEIGILASSLNEMSERLEAALTSLKAANNQLQNDIEKEKQQEKQRVDFFTAVSHELKTPITIIKGELEGMIYQIGAYKDRDVYLRHSLKTVDEMEKLVKEIIAAARMGGSDFKIAAINLNISEMVQRCCRKLQGVAEDKGIEMILDIQPDFHYRGDEKLIVKAFSNIIGNAVSYSPDDAKVFITLKDSELCVENTGIHISDNDLKQIFIPFYRIDKSHNRNTGGSGLGLYIVKTIFEHHGISYQMANTEQGVKFTVSFCN